MTIHATLAAIQTSLVAKKDKFNKFGGYSYRSAESILESLKPHLKQHGCTIKLDDEMQEVGGRVYVKATATLTNAEGESVSASAYAREAVSRKGMDDSQLTGATSSYARKYALGGLFAIDDSSDHDAMNVTDDYSEPQAQQPSPITYQQLNELNTKYDLLTTEKKESFADWLNTTFKVTDMAHIDQAHYQSVINGIDNVLKSIGVAV